MVDKMVDGRLWDRYYDLKWDEMVDKMVDGRLWDDN